MKYKDLEVHIQVGGRPLEEFGVTTEAENTLTCWVASEEGKEFTILRSNSSVAQGLSLSTYVDGRTVGFSHINPRESRIMHGQRTSADSVLSLKFSKLQLTEDEEVTPSLGLSMDALGVIEICAVRADKRLQTAFSNVYKAVDIGPVHERSKKAGVHCVVFGEEKIIGTTRGARCINLDSWDRPYCKLRFRYRPQDILQAQGTIPLPIVRSLPQVDPGASSSRKRPNAPEKSTDNLVRARRKKPRRDTEALQPTLKEDPDGFEGEDNEALQAQLDAMAVTMNSLKANMDGIFAKLKRANGKGPAVVKREPSPIRMNSSGDVIDLTSD